MENANKGYSRRDFLGSAVLAGAGALATGALLSSCGGGVKSNEELGLPAMLDAAPDGKKLRAGLVGCGHRGIGSAVNFLSAGPNLEIAAVGDVFQDRVDEARKQLKEQKNVELTDDKCFVGLDAFEQVLAADIDVVLLVTPPYFRPEQFAAAIRARKHVFMEKPVAVDPVGVRSLLATAEKAKAQGLCVVAGTQRRHQRDYIETYKQIAGGIIGKPLAAKAYWNQSHVWFKERDPGMTDMEYMLRNWNNFAWLSGDHIVEQHVHNIDIINWFSGQYPAFAIGFGGRHRRVTGDQYDFFSVDFNYGEGFSMHSMCRQIDECANGIGEVLVGTKGLTNCQNKIFDHDGKLLWEYDYAAAGGADGKLKISEYVQEHINLVTAIRTGKYLSDAEACAKSTLTAIMGRTSAYTGKRITWEEMMKSDMKLGPETLAMGPVDMKFEVPIPGRAVV